MRTTMLALSLALVAGGAQAQNRPFAPLPTNQAVAKGRKTISDGERAAATWAVQNLMSRHEYMHAAIRNLEELDNYWVSRGGKFAATATFGSPDWVMYGLETIRNAYGLRSNADAKAGMANISKLDPAVRDVPENYGAGAEWVMHTSTTPLIEIAGDGKTAQGAWYSPGMGVMPIYKDGKIKLQAIFFWEKYGGDFVRENGVWKIWHLQMAYDFTPGMPDSMLEQLNGQLGALALRDELKGPGAEAGERPDFALPEGFRKPKYSYKLYGPRRPAAIWPNLPQPYFSFGETFNNCNCDQELPK